MKAKEYRFKSNPKEKEIHDKFIKNFSGHSSKKMLSAIIFGWEDGQKFPNEYLTKKEEGICLNMMQWLGSLAGQNFLRDCGFKLKQ